jgi:hypothetical protein
MKMKKLMKSYCWPDVKMLFLMMTMIHSSDSVENMMVEVAVTCALDMMMRITLFLCLELIHFHCAVLLLLLVVVAVVSILTIHFVNYHYKDSC